MFQKTKIQHILLVCFAHFEWMNINKNAAKNKRTRPTFLSLSLSLFISPCVHLCIRKYIRSFCDFFVFISQCFKCSFRKMYTHLNFFHDWNAKIIERVVLYTCRSQNMYALHVLPVSGKCWKSIRCMVMFAFEGYFRYSSVGRKIARTNNSRNCQIEEYSRHQSVLNRF